jgi:hypothetical protein
VALRQGLPRCQCDASLPWVAGMKAQGKKNIAASVRERLFNISKKSGEPFDLVLVRYALERFLYRIGVSPVADRFVLKGALL